MAEALLFDPTSENTGTELDVMADPYAVTSMSFPAPGLETQTVGGIDTEGDSIAARRHQNRTISLTVEVTGTSQANLDASVATLEAKVAKAALQGGTLRRVRADGSFRTLDLLAADSYEKSFDIIYFTGLVAVCQISLVAKPYARLAEVALTTHSETALPVISFAENITGDVPALGRLKITYTQTGSSTKTHAIWGIESKNYDATTAATTSALYYEAETSTLSAGTVVTGPTGASGGASNNAVRHNYSTLPNAAFFIGSNTTPRAHVGTFAVFARVRVPSTNAGITYVRAVWTAGQNLLYSTTNPAVAVVNGAGVAMADTWVMLKLGLVRPAKQLGVRGWYGYLESYGATTTGTIYYDGVWLVPVAESSGVSRHIGLVTSDNVQVTDTGVYDDSNTGAGNAFAPALSMEGDYLRLPTGTTRVTASLVGDVGVTGATSTMFPQPAVDDFTAQLFYTPRMLTVT